MKEKLIEELFWKYAGVDTKTEKERGKQKPPTQNLTYLFPHTMSRNGNDAIGIKTHLWKLKYSHQTKSYLPFKDHIKTQACSCQHHKQLLLLN